MIGEDIMAVTEQDRNAPKSQSSRKSPTTTWLIIAFYAYVIVMGVIISTLDPLKMFDNWSARKISQSQGPYGGTIVRLPVWGSLSPGQKALVVVAVAALLIGMTLLSKKLVRKGRRIVSVCVVSCLAGIVILFGLVGVSYLQYMAASCLTDAWFHLAKLAIVGTVAALPFLLFKRSRPRN
jgi:hypothetical protein